MSSDWVIRCANVGKSYQIYPVYDHRLLQMLFGRLKKFYQDFWVLRDISFDVKKGRPWPPFPFGKYYSDTYSHLNSEHSFSDAYGPPLIERE